MDDFKLFENIEEDLSPIYSSAWEVMDDGCICYKGHPKFVIDAKSLAHGNKLTEVLSKVLDKGNATALFYFAFMQALKNAGYSTITIDLNGLHKPIIVK